METNTDSNEALKQALLAQYTDLKQSQELRKKTLLEESAKILLAGGNVEITDDMAELGIVEEITAMKFRAYVVHKVSKLKLSDDDE